MVQPLKYTWWFDHIPAGNKLFNLFFFFGKISIQLLLSRGRRTPWMGCQSITKHRLTVTQYGQFGDTNLEGTTGNRGRHSSHVELGVGTWPRTLEVRTYSTTHWTTVPEKYSTEFKCKSAILFLITTLSLLDAGLDFAKQQNPKLYVCLLYSFHHDFIHSQAEVLCETVSHQSCSIYFFNLPIGCGM